MFLGGLAVIVLATESGIGVYDDTLFWVHMIQHLMLIMIAPAMLVVGQPVTLLMHASRNPVHTWVKRVVRSRVATWLTSPWFGIAAYTAVIVGTHLTGFMSLVMTSTALHDAEHALYLVVGYLFFLPLLGREPIRWRISYPTRIFVLFLTMPVDTFTGLILSMQGSPLRATDGPAPPGSPSPLQDIHWAGSIMWVAGDALMFGFMMLVFLIWARADQGGATSLGWLEKVRSNSFEHTTGATGRAVSPAAASPASPAATPAAAAAHGTIDDDEHLAAYNAYLARINAAQSRGHDARAAE
jgi:putative copper resistance protein D